MKNITLLFLFFCLFYKGFSQNRALIEKVASEKVYLHYNSNYYLSGDKIFYSFYCLNQQTKTLSNLSKLAYVELLNSDKKSVFKHKIKLDKGIGYGDFFIPSSIKTGSYKIIGYTNWIKNFGIDNFFIQDIFIINPYQDNSNFIVEAIEKNANDRELKSILPKLFLKTNKDKFLKRELVKLKIEAIKSELSFGNYSISIKKKDSLDFYYKNNSLDDYYTDKGKKVKISQIKYIPEFRGEIIQGKVTDVVSGKPIFNCFVSFSIPDKDYIFKIVQTNSDGVFFIPIYENYNKSKAILSICNKNREKYKLTIKKDTLIDFNGLKFKDFKIPKKYLKSLILKSTDTQIQNSYSFLKQDSLISLKIPERFFSLQNEKTIIYNLDDFTRFKTLKETLTEIITSAYYYKRKGNYYLAIRNDDFILKNKPPLVLVDGVRILDINKIINLNTKKVKRIILRNDDYFYGNEVFNGIIAIETYKGDYTVNTQKSYNKILKLFKPEFLKQYYKIDYSKNKQKRIPDFRYQLFWEPNLKLNEASKEILFYTSDKTGVFEIILQGFTNSGVPISIKKEFTVE